MYFVLKNMQFVVKVIIILIRLNILMVTSIKTGIRHDAAYFRTHIPDKTLHTSEHK
jgi:hypothetical protein